MRLAPCKALCETCRRAVAVHFSTSLCECETCWESGGIRTDSQPLSGSITALRLCERCEKAPALGSSWLCLVCSSCDSGIPLQGRSEETPSGACVPSEIAESGVPDPWDATDEDTAIASAKGLSSGMETGLLAHFASSVPAGMRLPSWFAMLCEDIQVRETQKAKRRQGQHSSSSRIALASTGIDKDSLFRQFSFENNAGARRSRRCGKRRRL